MNHTEKVWVRKQATRILQELNYDLDSDKSVHEQFLERHKEALSQPTKKKKVRKKIDRTN